MVGNSNDYFGKWFAVIQKSSIEKFGANFRNSWIVKCFNNTYNLIVILFQLKTLRLGNGSGRWTGVSICLLVIVQSWITCLITSSQWKTKFDKIILCTENKT